MTTEKIDLFEAIDSEVEIKNGDTYWLGTKVEPCPKCGVAATNVDDCGHFGDPECPGFGIGREAYDKMMNKQNPTNSGE